MATSKAMNTELQLQQAAREARVRSRSLGADATPLKRAKRLLEERGFTVTPATATAVVAGREAGAAEQDEPRRLRNRRVTAAAHQKRRTDATTPNTTTINSLPPELLIEVFSSLSVQQLEASVVPVCRLWRDICSISCLRQQLVLEGPRDKTASACQMLRSCPKLAQLIMILRSDAEALLRAVVTHNHELRRLSIVHCTGSHTRPYLPADVLNKLLLRCPKLVDLTIKHSTFRSNKFFHDLGSLLPELRKLNLNYSSSFGSDALKMIALHCGKLEEIRALRRRSPNSTVPHCSDQDVWLVAKRLSATLRVLKIDGAMLSDDGMDALAQCSELRTLCVRHAFSVTDWGVAHLTKLRRLESLDLTGMGVVSPAGWCRLFSECSWSQLRGLSLSLCISVNDDVLREVARVCPGLVKISLACCMLITEAGVAAVIQACPGLECMNICSPCHHIYRSFILIPTNTPRLKNLVYNSFGGEEETSIYLFLKQRLPNLIISHRPVCLQRALQN